MAQSLWQTNMEQNISEPVNAIEEKGKWANK
jgi:hypothetical protein